MKRKIGTKNRKQGFSLQELLITIAVIGVLGLIARPFFVGKEAEGQDESSWASLKNLQTAVDQYVDANGSIPTTWLNGITTGDATTNAMMNATGKTQMLTDISTFGSDQTFEITNESSSNFTACYLQAGNGRIKILQYCVKLDGTSPQGNVVNFDRSVSTAFYTGTGIAQNVTTSAALTTAVDGSDWPH